MAETATPKPTPEQPPRSNRAWRICCRCGRILRVAVIVAVVVAAAALIYLSQVGLPPNLQERLTARLRAQGWDVQFSKLRVSFSRVGLLAENVYLRRTNGPQIYVRRAQCRVRPTALRRMNLEISTIKLSGARVIWPLANTNQLATTFLVNNISGELHFREHDIWDLQSFGATFMGARLNLSGTLTNGSLVRDWRVPQLRRGVPAKNLAKWRAILEAAHQIQFEGRPELITRFDGDAADLEGSRANLMLRVPAVTSPWGSGTNLLISARLNDGPDAATRPLELDVLFEQGLTPWAQAKAFRFKTRVGLDFERLIAPTNLNALIEAESAEGPWGAVNKLAGEVALAGARTDPGGLQTIFNLTTGSLRRERFEAATAEIHATAWHTRTNWFIEALRDLAATNRPLNERLEQLPMEADFSLAGAKAGVVDAEELLVRTQWRWPIATVAVEGKIEDGGLRARSTLNTTNREVTFDASSDVDPHRVSPLLTERSRNWLTNYQWQAAPKIAARGRFTFPPPDVPLDWARDVLPNVAVEGSFELGPCRYRAVSLDAAKSPFWFSNSVFGLPAIEVRSAGGFARGEYLSRPSTKDFHWRLNCQLDPRVLSPLFSSPQQQRAFKIVEFSVPPRINADIRGRWQDPTRLSVVGNVEATNFAVRGQPVQLVRAGVTFTNLQLSFVEPEVIRPHEYGTASRVTIDLADQRIYFTNAQGNLNPNVVARAIGATAARVIAPYVFAAPPDVHLNGVLDIKSGRREDDMHFLISGGPFYWDPFHANRIGGKLHWAGNNIFLNEVIAQLHGGQAKGDAIFNIHPSTTNRSSYAQFSFRTEFSDIDLRSLVSDLSPRTNSLEGVIRGNLQITSASSANRKSWNGRGMVELKDGLLWDFAMFGAFSPVLNAFMPGLGNSRARDGGASFIITNSVIHTTDLEINATAMRMQFNGTFDFDRRINGRMEAELLRNVPAVGFLLSKILWPVTKIFEYKVTGTLQEPKTEPLYLIPKLILIPFSPIKTIRDLLGVGDRPPALPPTPRSP